MKMTQLQIIAPINTDTQAVQHERHQGSGTGPTLKSHPAKGSSLYNSFSGRYAPLKSHLHKKRVFANYKKTCAKIASRRFLGCMKISG